VAHHVGHRLLHHPEGGQVDAGWQAAGGGGVDPVDRHVESGRPRALDQRGQVGQPGGRLAGRRLAHAQDVEHRAQLAQRVAAGVADDGQRRAGLLGVLVQQVEGHPRLDGDEGDVVGQHVVELLGDAQPLLAGLAAGLLGPDGLGLRGLLAAAADQLDPGGQGHQPGADAGDGAPVGEALVADGGRDPAGDDPPGHQAGPCHPAVSPHDGVDVGDQQGQEHRPAGVVGQPVGHGGHERGHQAGHRPSGAQQQRRRPRHQQQDRPPVERPDPGLVPGGHRHHRHLHERARGRGCDQPHPPGQPGAQRRGAVRGRGGDVRHLRGTVRRRDGRGIVPGVQPSLPRVT
jgi:hypothetical protein